MGGHGFRVKGPAELKSVLQEALKTEGPCLVDVPINPDELTLPPKITLSQAFGFGLAKFRELLESR
jgi:pyruvate dehydrogenase (quinone)